MAGLLCALYTFAQPAGFKKVANDAAFRQSFTKATQETQTIESDFTQVKELSMLSEKVNSKGKFYYKKDSKVRIEYTQPYFYLMVMNAGQVMVKDDQKKNTINAKSNKMMQSVNQVMLDCVRGTAFQNKDLQTTVFESNKEYLLDLKPVNAALKNLMGAIQVYMDKTSFEVTRLTIVEKGGDKTTMTFFNRHNNKTLSDALFAVK